MIIARFDGCVPEAMIRVENSVGEYDGPVAVDESAVVDVVADSFGEGGALAVAAEAGEVVG